jgi:hypothetical protein
MNIQEASETVDLFNRVDILWKERELITAVLYQDYCQRNNLPVPKHIDVLLQTAYQNLMTENTVQVEDKKEEVIPNIKPKDFR